MSRLIPICGGSFISLPFPHRWNSQRLHECYCSKDERNPPTGATRRLALITKTNDLFFPCQLCSLMFKPFFSSDICLEEQAELDILESKGWWRFRPSKFALECSSWRFFLSPQDSSWSLLLKVISESSSWSFPALCRCFISAAEGLKIREILPAQRPKHRRSVIWQRKQMEKWPSDSRGKDVMRNEQMEEKKGRTREWTKQMERDEWENDRRPTVTQHLFVRTYIREGA